MEILFKEAATAIGGREGKVTSAGGKFVLDLAMPGSKKEGANPEQLFAMGYSACFDSALSLIWKTQKASVTGTSVTAEVGLGKSNDVYGLDIDLHVDVHGVSQEIAEQLVEAAHQVCPYSNALRGNVDVRLHVTAHP